MNSSMIYSYNNKLDNMSMWQAIFNESLMIIRVTCIYNKYYVFKYVYRLEGLVSV